MVQEPHGFYDLGLISVRPSLREWAWASLKTVKLEKKPCFGGFGLWKKMVLISLFLT
jgi:hypothetical protein